MRCPKCGFHSFETQQECKKCGHDLAEHKAKFQIGGTLIRAMLKGQGEVAEDATIADASSAETASDDAPVTDQSDFDFGLMDDEATSDSAPEATSSASTSTSGEEEAFSFEEGAVDFSQPDQEVEAKAASEETREPSSTDAFDEEEALAGLELDDLADFSSEEEEGGAVAPREAEEKKAKDDDDDDHDDEGASPPGASDGGDEIDFSFEDAPWRRKHDEMRINRFDDAGEAALEKGASNGVFAMDAGLGVVAGLGARLAAGIFDLALLVLLGAVFLMAGELAMGRETLLPPIDTLLTLGVYYYLVLFAWFFGYFTLFHFLSGETPGKMLFRIRVESLSGAGLTFSQSFLRSVGGLISLVFLGAGYLIVLLDRSRRGWNDRIAGTQVVFSGLTREFDGPAPA